MTPARNSSRQRARTHASAHGRRLTPAAELARRHEADARARTYRRRRLTTVAVAIALVVGLLAVYDLAGGNGKPHIKTAVKPTVTPTTVPSSYEVGIHTFDLTESGDGIGHVGPTGNFIAGRTLRTEVRYPTLAGIPGSETTDASPTTDGGPFPVIVFAHGFETDPASYSSMLDAWVAAGMVVVSPIFPDENSQAVTAAGGNTNSDIASTLETDEFNEPGDIAFVLKQLENPSALSWGSHLQGLLDLSDVGLAGQSDGADVVAALAYASSLHTLYKSMPVTPKAVAILSGTAWGALGSKPIGTYSAGSGAPAVLQVQSDADGCVSPTQAVDLFSQLQTGQEPKWFVTLLGADHLGPYEGTSPWASIVQTVTTDFFELELNWRAGSLTPASIEAAGDVSKAAQASTSVNDTTMPQVASVGSCDLSS